MNRNEEIQLRPDEYIDKNGRKRRRIGTVPRCECCGAVAEVK